MAGNAVVKAVIEVEFDDLNKAQLALKKAGVEVVNFGESAGKAKAKAGGFTQSVGDLSEKLDKGLEKGLGRAFKATDRFQSILGQVGTVGTIVATVVGGIATGVGLMADAMDQGSAAVERTEKGLFDVAEAANVAKSAVAEMQKAFDEGAALSIESALRRAQIRQEIAAKSAQAEIFLAYHVAAEKAEASRLDFDPRDRIKQAAGRYLEGTFKAGADARLAQIQDLTDKLKRELAPADLFEGLSHRLGSAFSTALSAVDAGADETTKRARKVATDTANIFEDAADEIVYQWGLLPSRIDVALSGWVPGTEWADSFKPALGDLADALGDDFGAAFENIAYGMDKAAAASKPFTDTVAKLSQTLEASGEAAAAAAFDAIVYGDSFSSQLNDFAESQAKMAAISAAMETAKGIAASFLSPELAGAHFASAAAFAATAALAGGVAMATGGFDGSGGGGGGDGGGGSTDPAVAQSRTGRPAPDTGSMQPIIVFEGAVYDTEGAAARAFGAVSANAINASSNSRGAPRVRQAAIRRGRR